MRALRFGLIPRGDDDGSAREREFVLAASAALGNEVEVHRAADYRAVVAGLQQGLVDIAWLPPLVAARALRAKLVEAVALVVRYGETAYKSTLVARPDSRVKSLEDLRSVRVAWVDRESASGYAVLRSALARAGVSLTQAFALETFVRSHAAVARAVIEGTVDVGATCGHVGVEGDEVRIARSPFAGDAGLTREQLRVVFAAGPIPSDLFAVRASAPAHIKQALARALLQGMPERLREAAKALSHADSFILPTVEHAKQLDALVDA